MTLNPESRRRILSAASISLLGIVLASSIGCALSPSESRLRRNVLNTSSPSEKVCALATLLRHYEAHGRLGEITWDNYNRKLGIGSARTVRYDFASLPSSMPTTCEMLEVDPGDTGGSVILVFSKERGTVVSWYEMPEIKLPF